MKKSLYQIPGKQQQSDAANSKSKQAILPEARIETEKDEYVVYVDMPGLDRKDFSVSFCENQLKISGNRPIHIAGTTVKRPLFLNSWEQSFLLPADADTMLTAALFRKGELEIHIPKCRKQEFNTSALIEVVVY